MSKPKLKSSVLSVASLLCVIMCAAPLVTKGSEFTIRTDVIPSSVPQEVMLVEHDFAPGDSSGWHIHHGAELAFVLSGTFELRIAGEKLRLVTPGDTFRIARETPHEVRNVGKTDGHLIISYLMDKGVAWMVAVEEPIVKQPNQLTGPTPPSVTPAAVQPARQP
jgi:quercetin dioxygenase-like cupin family protein